MTDTASRDSNGAARLLADALLRSVSGATASLRVTSASVDSCQEEIGVVPSAFSNLVISPVVMRKLRATLPVGDMPKWELLVSATSIAQTLATVSLASAKALFAMTLAVSVGAQDYLIESVAANEAFGRVYLYRLVLSEARPQAL
jgi:hypothetical protein